VRNTRRAILNLSLPAPHPVVRFALTAFLAVRSAYYFFMRVFICEPLFKAYCSSYGRDLHTGVFVHWVQGSGRILIGDHVTIDGKSSFIFASRYAEQAMLRIGDYCGIGHGCMFTVGREISIGRRTRIAEGVTMFDSPGHPADPAARLSGKPATNEDVRPICIGDNVWIGRGAYIYPGVTIGDNAVVAAGAVVMTDVPPNTLVAGNPARQTRTLGERPSATRKPPSPPIAPSAPGGPPFHSHLEAFESK
jgi:serine acetyltransferase